MKTAYHYWITKSKLWFKNFARPNILCFSRAFCPFKRYRKKLQNFVIRHFKSPFDLFNLICRTPSHFQGLGTHRIWWNTMLDQFISVCNYCLPIEYTLREKIEDLVSANLNRHFDLLNDIFMKARKFFSDSPYFNYDKKPS